jgi:hypothetical protein
MEQRNIDRLCADIGFSIPKGYEKKDELSKQENTIRKSLGILAQDGIFAYLIWLESEKSLNPGDKVEEKVAKNIHEYTCKLLKSIEFVGEDLDYKELKEELKKSGGILDDVHQMFLVKQLFERMLTYSLYSARALP